MSGTFVAERAVRAHSFNVDLAPADAFPLFEPEGEKRWAEGWSPDYVFPPGGRAEAGMVFTTAHGGEDTTWMLLRHNPKEGVVEYVRLTPGNRIATVLVQCAALNTAPGATRTRVNVVYTFTGLSPAGNAYIKRMDEDHYREYIGGWAKAISKALAR